MRSTSERGPKEVVNRAVRGMQALPAWVPRLGYYGLALLFVAAAATLRWMLPGVLGPVPFLVFYLAWVGAATFGGLGPGLLATAASWLCVELLFDFTPGRAILGDPTALARLTILMVGGLTVSLIAERMRRGRIREHEQEQALRESEQRYHRFFEDDLTGDFISTPGGRILLCNPAFAEMFGFSSAQEAVGTSILDLYLDPRERASLLERLKQEGKIGRFEVWRKRRDGEPVHIVENLVGHFNEQGELYEIKGYLFEDTERKRAEEALRERMKELACLYAVSRDIQEDLSIDELCPRAVEHLVPAMQSPEITVPVIELNGRRFTSENFTEGLSHGLHAQIRVQGEVLGHLKVYYAQERPFIIPEEQNLVNGVAEALSTWLVRKRAEEALRESEQRLKRSQEIAHLGSWELDLAKNEFTWSDEVYRIFGLEPGEFAATYEAFLEAVHPEDRAAVDDAYSGSLREGRDCYEIEHRVVRKSTGEIRNVHEKCQHVRNDSGQIVRSMGMVQDITKRKRAEEELRQSERQFKSTFENAAIGIAHVALDGRILQFNSRFCEIAGYSSDDVLGKTCEQITFADDWKAEKDQIQRLLDGRVDHYSIEKRYIRMDGSPVWVNLTRSVQRDDAGQPEYFIVLVEDISDRKRAEEALRELTATLENKVAQRTAELKHRARQLQKLTLDMSEAEDRERRRLAEILHDDLQQVLAAAKFHLGLMRNQARQDPSVQDIGTAIDRMLREAIEKTRSLSHEISPAVLHHGDFAETLGWLANQIQAKHGLVVHVHADGDVRTQSDALKAFLYKAAQELLFNIVKHARVNEARIRVRRAGRCIGLSVSDRGRGFDPQDLGKAAGFGLLSIRERIELLGGRMKIRSAPGKGSTFFVVVPDGEFSGTDGVELGSDSRAQSEDARRVRVLLADDHEIVREGLALLLSEEFGIEVVGEASNGREAVALADRLEPDVVIMDVAMPLMSGDEAARQIKQHRPTTRVVALSMFEDRDTAEKMHAAGAEAYVLKTAPCEDLLAAIRGD